MGFFLSLARIAVNVIFTALMQHVVSRTKERIAPIGSRDDSEATDNK